MPCLPPLPWYGSIFSKKYIENPPELKGEKQKHNVRTLKKMAEMMVSQMMAGVARENMTSSNKKH